MATPTSATILVIEGDHIGPEVTKQGVKVLDVLAGLFGLNITYDQALMGGCAYDAHGVLLPAQTSEKAFKADAILFGAQGGPEWDDLRFKPGIGKGLNDLRKQLGGFANLRLSKAFSNAVDASPLRPERVAGADILIVRELTGGIYFGEPRGRRVEDGQRIAINTMVYSEGEIERIVRLAFHLAQDRRQQLVCVDKANVLEVGRLWRDIFREIAKDFPNIQARSLYVDAAAMELIQHPSRFDVLVTQNLFGDILSDGAGVIPGTLGMLPSATLGGKTPLFEPCHGSAPDISGKDIANPIASILSVGMLLRHHFGLGQADEQLHEVVNQVLATHRTADMMAAGKQQVGCQQMGDLIAERLAKEISA